MSLTREEKGVMSLTRKGRVVMSLFPVWKLLSSKWGPSLEVTVLERCQCESEKFARWCILQGDVISKTGEFDWV